MPCPVMLARRYGPSLLVAAAATWAVAALVRRRRRWALRRRVGVLFTGTGCSSGLPMMKCRRDPCGTCASAMRNGPSDPNDRGNVGLLVRVRLDGTWRHIQIDVGKTFRQSVLRWTKQVSSLDAVVLTHDHADAVLGLDEIRGLQPWDATTRRISGCLRCFCDARTLRSMRRVFPYLFPRAPPDEPGAFAATNGVDTSDSGGDSPSSLNKVQERFVAKIDWATFGTTAATEPASSSFLFEPVAGFPMRALPVLHGDDYTAYGFAFGPPGARVAYVSDFTKFLPATVALLDAWRAEPEGIALLILDCLSRATYCPFHPTLEDCVALARTYRAGATRLVGMGHTMEHRVTNRDLAILRHTEGLDVQLAHDGLFIGLDLC